MLDLLGTVFSGIFAGGATGLIGAIIQRYADYKNAQLQLSIEKMRGDFDLAKRAADAQIMREEWAGRSKVQEIASQGATDVADAGALAASYQREPDHYADTAHLTAGQNWLMVALDFIRASISPGLTVYLCVLTTLIYADAHTLLKTDPLNEHEAAELVKLIVGTVLYLFTTCTLWYFGARNRQQPPKPGN
jgi:hypothetical protein